MKKNRALRTSTSPLEQVERLIIEPSKDLYANISPLVIDVDALDESGDEVGRSYLLPAISEQMVKGPSDRPSLRSHFVYEKMGNIPEQIANEDTHKFVHHHQYTDLSLNPLGLTNSGVDCSSIIPSIFSNGHPLHATSYKGSVILDPSCPSG